jgi:SAM-dependent methyltransferase
MAATRPLYLTDLAYIHDRAFGDLANGMAPELIRILARHGIRRGRIVDAGCGSGILARHLLDAGYRVIGIDASPAMIRLARARAPKATFRVASIAKASMPRCDAVVAIGEVMTYLPSRRAVERFFRRVRAALAPGGLFLFDFIESGERRHYAPKIRGGDDWALVAQAGLARDGRVITRRLTMFRKVRGTYRRSRETHHVRVYSRDEMAAALARAGFVGAMRRSFGKYRLMTGDVAVVAMIGPP